MGRDKTYSLGILGGGQLGCLLAYAIQKKTSIPSTFKIFCTHKDDPAFHFFPEQATLLTEIKQLESCDTVFLESEFHSYDDLRDLQCSFIPEIKNYQHFYGKINQRLFYKALGLAQPDFLVLNSEKNIVEINFDFPVMLKKNLFSYDGYGNREANTPQELIHYANELGFPLLVEKKLKLKTEIAIGLVFDGNDVIELPWIETFQKNYICHYVTGPAKLSLQIENALRTQIKLLKEAPLKGLFAFEFFVTENDQVFINEGAARPHNSQHLSMELCHKSQFDYLVDVALGIPLEKPIVLAAEGAMVNLLGKSDRENPDLSLPPIPAHYPHTVYLYGKKQGRVGRKMGHLNILNPFQDKNFFNFLDKLSLEYEL